MNLQDPSLRRKKCLKFLGCSAVGLAGLLAVWIVGGNYIASQQEKEIEQDLAEFAQRFPKTEPNDSALKLAALVAKLGINVGGGPFSPVDRYMESSDEFTPSEGDRKAFEEIKEELGQYLDAQITKPNDAIDPPSDKLQRYLASKQTVLAAIRQHVLTNEAPHWGTDITDIVEGDPTAPLPSYLWQVDFQRILALDALEKYRQGQMKAAAQNLEVSWKINQSLTESPYLIGQLVALIVTKYQAGAMRKVDDLPAEWQQRLMERDYRESLLISVQGQALYSFKFFQHFLWQHSGSSVKEVLAIDFRNSTLPTLFMWFNPALKPYFRLSAIDTYRVNQRSLAASRQQNVCVSDSVTVDGFSRWNYIGRSFDKSWMSNLFSSWMSNQFSESAQFIQFSKSAQSMLDLELINLNILLY